MSAEALTIDGLERWVLSGATWCLIDISAERAVVDLCACTGEPMQRLTTSDPAVIDYLRTAPSGRDLTEDKGA